jgi:hypothetical protein
MPYSLICWFFIPENNLIAMPGWILHVLILNFLKNIVNDYCLNSCIFDKDNVLLTSGIKKHYGCNSIKSGFQKITGTFRGNCVDRGIGIHF